MVYACKSMFTQLHWPQVGAQTIEFIYHGGAQWHTNVISSLNHISPFHYSDLQPFDFTVLRDNGIPIAQFNSIMSGAHTDIPSLFFQLNKIEFLGRYEE